MRIDIYQFAAAHGLTLKVERLGTRNFHASFPRSETKEYPSGSILISTYGRGHTAREAVRSYVRSIRFTTLVIDAYKPTRKEILVPDLKIT